MNSSRNILSAQHGELTASTRWLNESDLPRAKTLALLDQVIDWVALEQLVRPVYSADLRKTQGGRRGHSLVMMTRVLAIGIFWRGSYRALAAAVADSSAFAAFAGTPIARRPPAWTRIRDFTKLLAESYPPGEALPLLDLVGQRIRSDLLSAGIECIAGTLREPILRARASGAVSSAKAEAMATTNAELARAIAERRSANES